MIHTCIKGGGVHQLVHDVWSTMFNHGDEVHRKTDTLPSGNNMTAAGLEPQTLRSGGSSSNH